MLFGCGSAKALSGLYGMQGMGAMPAGLSISDACVLSGYPSGTAAHKVLAADGSGLCLPDTQIVARYGADVFNGAVALGPIPSPSGFTPISVTQNSPLILPTQTTQTPTTTTSTQTPTITPASIGGFNISQFVSQYWMYLLGAGAVLVLVGMKK